MENVDINQLPSPTFKLLDDQIDFNEEFRKLFGFPINTFSTRFETIFLSKEIAGFIAHNLAISDSMSGIVADFLTYKGATFKGYISFKTQDSRSLNFIGSVINIDKLVVSPTQPVDDDLKQKAEMFESINQNLTEAVIRSDKNGIVYSNESGIKLFKFHDLEDMKRRGMDSFYKDDQERDRLLSALKETGEVNDLPILLKTSEGKVFNASLTTKKRKGPDGEFYNDTTIRDITDKVQKEDRINKLNSINELLLRTSLKYLNIPLETIQTELNNSLHELIHFFQLSRSVIIETALISGNTELIHSYDRDLPEEHESTIQNLIDKSKSLFSINNSGDLTISNLLEPVQNQNGREMFSVVVELKDDFVLYSGLFESEEYDIEEFKGFFTLILEIILSVRRRSKNESERLDLFERTQSQNEILMRYSQWNSHNLRSSIVDISTVVVGAEGESNLSESLSRINSYVARIDKSLHSFNELFQLENSNDEVEFQSIKLKDFVRNILLELEEACDSKNVSLKVEILTDLHVYSVKSRLRTAIKEVVKNCLDHGVNANNKKINISARMVKGEVLLIIEDFGNGFESSKYGLKVFDFGTRYSERPSDGIGLYLAKKSIESAMGSIEISSKIDFGTTVSMKLKTSSESEDSDFPDLYVEEEVTEKKILLIDDDDILLSSFKAILKVNYPDFKIVTAKNGSEGVEKYEEDSYTAVFVDLNMPIMNGWEFLDRIAELYEISSSKIFIMTSSIDPADKKRAKQHPCAPVFVEKPLTPKKMRALGF